MSRPDRCTLFRDRDWNRSCCKKHDDEYSKGSGVPRSEADLNLYRCVRDNGKPVVAALMYAGVRCFGWLFYKGDK